MAKSSAFEIETDRVTGVYRIYWWIEESGDIGGALGEIHSLVSRKGSPKRGDEAEIWAVYQAVKKTPGQKLDACGFYWETERQAKAARAAADVALEALRSNKQWPDWAIRAKAEGWKAPRGWKP